MDWSKLYFGHVSPAEVKEAIKNDDWQETRLSMKGVSLEDKYNILSTYYKVTLRSIQESLYKGEIDVNACAHELRMLYVRCTNYVTALSRGGLIKPCDYKK